VVDGGGVVDQELDHGPVHVEVNLEVVGEARGTEVENSGATAAVALEVASLGPVAQVLDAAAVGVDALGEVPSRWSPSGVWR
jgi:hypothetical protein